jgi:hypothetical protein
MTKNTDDSGTMGRPKGKKETKTFSGYFPTELLNLLKEEAEMNRRSVNNHVIYILEKYFKKKGQL